MSLFLFQCCGFKTPHSVSVCVLTKKSIDKVTFLWLTWPVFCDLEELGDRQRSVGVEMFSYVGHLQKFTAGMSCVRPSQSPQCCFWSCHGYWQQQFGLSVFLKFKKGGDVTGLACVTSENNSCMWSHLFASVNTDDFSRDFVLSRNISLNTLRKNRVYLENAV